MIDFRRIPVRYLAETALRFRSPETGKVVETETVRDTWYGHFDVRYLDWLHELPDFFYQHMSEMAFFCRA